MPIWVGWIISAVLKKLAALFANAIIAYEKDLLVKKAAEAQAAQDNAANEKINEGSTSDEIDAAADESLKHL